MKFLGKFRRLTGPDASKKITRSALECEVTQKLRERGAAGDFSPVRWGLHYTGTVQGVGFRWTTQNIARERHLTGWVINREDGSVDMELQGPSVQISALMDDLQDCYAGWGANICLSAARELKLEDTEGSFEVRF